MSILHFGILIFIHLQKVYKPCMGGALKLFIKSLSIDKFPSFITIFDWNVISPIYFFWMQCVILMKMQCQYLEMYDLGLQPKRHQKSLSDCINTQCCHSIGETAMLYDPNLLCCIWWSRFQMQLFLTVRVNTVYWNVKKTFIHYGIFVAWPKKKATVCRPGGYQDSTKSALQICCTK